MSDGTIYRPRLSVELTKPQYDKFNLVTPYGMKRMVVTRLLEKFVEFVAKDPNNVMRVHRGDFTLLVDEEERKDA